MTAPTFRVESDPAALVEVPAAGTLSRTLHADGDVRVVVFGFAAGEELTEHTATRPAVIQVLRGRLELTLAGERVTAEEGAWVHMGAGLRHAIRAEAPAVMLLTLLTAGGSAE
jgi:quercetin dioxygenase-like cupin family protein